MASSFQGWVGAMWAMGGLDVVVITYAIWMIWRLFARSSTVILSDSSTGESKPAGPWG
jgi:hypothetical protein